MCDLQGLTEIEVRSMEDILMIMREGEQNRTVADTNMNTNRFTFAFYFVLISRLSLIWNRYHYMCTIPLYLCSIWDA